MNFYIYVCLILEFENMYMLIIIRIVLRVLYLRYLLVWVIVFFYYIVLLFMFMIEFWKNIVI